MLCLFETASLKPKQVCLHHCLSLIMSTCPIPVPKFQECHQKCQTSVSIHHSRPDFVPVCLFPNFPQLFWRSHHRVSHGRPPADPSPTSRWQPYTSQHPDNRLPYTNQHDQQSRGDEREERNIMGEERHMLRKCRSLTPAFLSFVLEASRHKRLAELDFTGCWKVG